MPGGVLDRQADARDRLLLCKVLQPRFKSVVVREHDHDGPQPGSLFPGDLGVQPVDEYGQGVVDLPREDQENGVLAVLFDEVGLLAGRAGHTDVCNREDVEGAGDRRPRPRA